MDQELSARLDTIYASVEQTRKYFFWTLVISIVFFVLPLIGLLLYLPSFLSSYSTALGTDSQNPATLQQQINELTQ